MYTCNTLVLTKIRSDIFVNVNREKKNTDTILQEKNPENRRNTQV